MHIRRDDSQFDECQIELLTAIIETISGELKKAKLDDDHLKELVTNIAFHVCCAVDGSLVMEKGGKTISPVLTFAGESDDEVISCGGGSYMHEYVHGFVEELLQPKPKTGFAT